MTDHPEDPRRQAVALSYREGESAPQVLAKGYGDMAERIIAQAQREGMKWTPSVGPPDRRFKL